MKASSCHVYFILALWCFLGTNQSFAQTTELDSLRAISSSSLKSKCDLCFAFAEYEMADSSFTCLEQLRSAPLTRDIELYATMVEAKAHVITYNDSKADSIYKALEQPLLMTEIAPEIRFRIEEGAIYFYRLFGRCYDALDWINMLISDAEIYKDPERQMRGIMSKATMVRCIDDKEDITTYDLQAEGLIETHPDLKGYYHELKGAQFYYEYSYPLAIQEYLKAAQFYVKDDKHAHLMRLCFAIADLYSELNTYRKTLVYFNRCKKFYETTELHDLGTLYNSMGWAFYELNENDSAIKYFTKSRIVHEYTSPSNPELAYPIGNLGLIHRKLGNLDSARIYSEQAIDLFTKLNVLTGVAEAENNLGFIGLQEGKLSEARKHFEEALSIAVYWEDPLEQLSAHHGLYMIKTESNPREALEHYQQFSILQNQLMTSEDELKALQFEVDLLLDQNEQLIKQLELDSELKSLKIEQQRSNLILTLFGMLVVLIMAGMLLFYWLNRRKLIDRLNESNEISQRIISMISHDFRGPLGNIRMMLSLLQEGNLEKEEFNELSSALYRQTTDVSLMYDSFIVWAMSQSDGYTPNNDEVIWPNIVTEAVQISEPIAAMKNMTIQVKGEAPDHMITDRMAANLILRNLLSNAIKYSHEDSKIAVTFHIEDGDVHTTVRDWGVGISEELLSKLLNSEAGSKPGTKKEYGSGLGLKLVIQFVSQLGGRIEAQSEEGKGSSFTVILPQKLP